MPINKIEYNGKTLIDLTGDTVTPEKILEGRSALNAAGQQIVGAMVDLSQDTITPEKLLKDYTAHDKTGKKIAGTMKDNGLRQLTIDSKSQRWYIDGFNSSDSYVEISETERNKIIPENIKAGENILGVIGTFEGEGGSSFDFNTLVNLGLGGYFYVDGDTYYDETEKNADFYGLDDSGNFSVVTSSFCEHAISNRRWFFIKPNQITTGRTIYSGKLVDVQTGNLLTLNYVTGSKSGMVAGKLYLVVGDFYYGGN